VKNFFTITAVQVFFKSVVKICQNCYQTA